MTGGGYLRRSVFGLRCSVFRFEDEDDDEKDPPTSISCLPSAVFLKRRLIIPIMLDNDSWIWFDARMKPEREGAHLDTVLGWENPANSLGRLESRPNPPTGMSALRSAGFPVPGQGQCQDAHFFSQFPHPASTNPWDFLN